MGSGLRGAIGGKLAENLGDVFALCGEGAARAAHCGSSRRRWPYSFMVEPQPAALMTMVSTLAASKMAMMLRAMAAACSSRPEWTIRAPQQGWSSGVMTSQPSAARTRAVAALTWEKKTCWTQPVSMPTRRRGVAAVARALRHLSR